MHDLETNSTATGPAALVRNGKLAQQLLDAAPDAMVIVAESGRITFVNQHTEELFGYKRQELLDQPVEVMLPERFRARHVEHRAHYAAEPRLRPMGHGLDLFGRYRDGTEFPVEIMLSPIRISGHLLISAAIRDISERKVVEAERDSQRLILQRLLDIRSREMASQEQELRVAVTMASIGTLAAGLVHDLINSLFPIRSHLQAMREQAGSESVCQHIRAVENTIGYINDLARRVRMLMTNTDDPERDSATNLNEWWREVQPLVASALPERIELEPDIPEDVPPVRVRRLDLTQAVFNLAHNAGRVLHGTKAGSVRIWARSSQAEHTVHVGVSDNGPGMPPDVQSHCMDPMYTSGNRNENIGLGLMLVKSIVTRAHGTIDIDSEPGRGTTFTLVLPAKE